ncbi:hypothetical protein [uncultured Tenacibaculum sp.]|uniref:hypothetical protein n=1 Tax=uncultured Tenacibaculum sp. TaxID=174713 RepID=UPI002632F04A|nr:hypothetical protein [uncultured Tenacibaculum sp.]
MKKSILTLGKSLNKTEQKNINGGFFTNNCFDITDSSSCNRKRGCQWYGCYCGPNSPHFAPC